VAERPVGENARLRAGERKGRRHQQARRIGTQALVTSPFLYISLWDITRILRTGDSIDRSNAGYYCASTLLKSTYTASGCWR